MGFDEGFDMVPPLSNGTADQRAWAEFMEAIKEKYKGDEQVEIKPHCIEFKAGEHPLLPFEGHKLLRFSSKVSMSNTRGVENYISEVRSMAKAKFGSRVHPWHEGVDIWGFYDWGKVNDSLASYERVSVGCPGTLCCSWLIHIQPDEPEVLSTISQLSLEEDTTTLTSTHLFEIRVISGKGKGLIARCDIAQGQRILAEESLFTLQSMPRGQLLEERIAARLRVLPKASVRQFLSLHNNFPGKFPFSGIFRTNALPCGVGSSIGAVYPSICLLNHSCVSNSHHSWNSDLERETIHAQRFIRAGEEITISYDEGSTYDQRRAKFKEAFGFECDCSRCSLPAPERQESDANRLETQRLDVIIGESSRVMGSPGSCLNDCRRLLNLLQKEYDGCALSSFARLYYDAFQIVVTHSDQARASIFAKRAYENRVLCEGEDSPATVRVKTFIKKPTSHRNYGISAQWKTTRTQAPKGLSEENFEKWLWRAS